MANWQKENQSDKAIKVILFIISPFFSFLYSLRHMNTRSSYVVFFLFAVFFGMAFSVPSGKSIEFRGDGASYRAKFDLISSGLNKHDFYDGFIDFIAFDEGKKDYYFDTIAYYVSNVTTNYHVLFLVFSVIFSYFALKSFRFFTEEGNFKLTYQYIVLVYLFTINQIININGVRFWTAAWIGVLVIFQVFRNGNWKYLFLLLLAPFIHGSYWVFIAVVFLALLFKRYEKTWVTLFFISFFISTISVEVISQSSSSLPPFLSNLVDAYTNEETVFKRGSISTTYQLIGRFFNFAVRFYMNFMVYLFIKNSQFIKANFKTKNLYLFLLVYMTFINFVMPVPSLGVRFFMLSFPVIAYIWLVNFYGRKYNRFLHFMPLVFLMSIYEQFSLYKSVLDISFLLYNPFSLIYKYLIAF